MDQGMSGGSEQIEARRQAELASYAILDTPGEAEFQDIVKAASEVCGMPVSLISLLDGERQWFKAETGFGRNETPLSVSICAYAVRQQDVLEIEDLTRDERTSANPLVTGGPRVRFYAGAPLRTSEGVALGALCVLDTKPNKLTPSQAFVLRTLANQVVTTLELRRSLRQREETDRRNTAILESAVDYAIVSMDLKGMVTSWSPGAERILGWDEAEMRGKPAHVFFTEEDATAGIPEQEMASALSMPSFIPCSITDGDMSPAIDDRVTVMGEERCMPPKADMTSHVSGGWSLIDQSETGNDRPGRQNGARCDDRVSADAASVPDERAEL